MPEFGKHFCDVTNFDISGRMEGQVRGGGSQHNLEITSMNIIDAMQPYPCCAKVGEVLQKGKGAPCRLPYSGSGVFPC